MTTEKTIDSVKNTLRAESDAVAGLLESLDMDALEEAIDAIESCEGRVLTSACGTSAIAARKLNHTLNCIRVPAAFFPPSDALHGALGGFNDRDVAVLVSKGGATFELEKMLESLTDMGVKTIAVTENSDSPLAKGADIFVKVRVEREPDEYNILATASTLAVIATFDAICLAITNHRGFDRDNFHVLHPGGAVGERLTGESLGN